MAEPQRAHAAAPRLPGARFLIVEARYYESVAALLLEGAKAAFEAAGAAFDVVRVTGALEIPAGIGDRARTRRAPTGAPTTARLRSAASFAATPIISRSSPASRRAR